MNLTSFYFPHVSTYILVPLRYKQISQWLVHIHTEPVRPVTYPCTLTYTQSPFDQSRFLAHWLTCWNFLISIFSWHSGDGRDQQTPPNSFVMLRPNHAMSLDPCRWPSGTGGLRTAFTAQLVCVSDWPALVVFFFFFPACEVFGSIVAHSFPASAFCVCFEVEISPRTLIPPFRFTH